MDPQKITHKTFQNLESPLRNLFKKLFTVTVEIPLKNFYFNKSQIKSD